MRRESPLAVSAVCSGEKALFGVTLCINEPCLKGRAYKRFGSFPGGQGSPPGWEGARRSGGMLQRDAEIPALRLPGVRGHKAGRDTVL